MAVGWYDKKDSDKYSIGATIIALFMGSSTPCTYDMTGKLEINSTVCFEKVRLEKYAMLTYLLIILLLSPTVPCSLQVQ
jgi:hypothetical protein